MTGSVLFRKLVLSAFLLIVAILLPLDIYFTHVESGLQSENITRAAIGEVHMRLLEFGLAAALIALVWAYFASRSVTRRLARVRAFADGFVDARSFPPPVAATVNDEIGSLVRAVNGMAARLSGFVESAKAQSAQHEAILETMVEGVLAVDEKLRITYSNRAFTQAVGVPDPIPDRTPVAEVVRHPALRDMLSEALRKGEPQERRLVLVLAGEERAFEVQAAPLASLSGPGAFAVLYDITHLERLERVRRDFVANVSHELRTPLTAIQGYSETLLEGGLEDAENSQRFVEIIKAHAIRLGNITSDLLTLSELESGRVGTPPESISIQAAVDSCLRTVSSAARLAGVRLVRGTVEEADVMGNRTHVEQVLVNLLDNGVKFNRPDGEVRIDSLCGPNGRVTVTVEDTGIGIPSEHLSRIFERFYRVDKARSRQAGGTGLGLSIVKHIVERMDGTVTVESNLGKGSKFTVTFPTIA
ncbi:MAG TPA: ATP-binding protein [Terriglobia bacterium]|nr:ATP-binding protein [Terriglobia bacterium]